MEKRVALIGARGIGRHHGNWWRLEGAEVCAFAGTNENALAETETTLRKLFGFAGRGYTDVSRMIAHEAPDIVDVCSPHACHAIHVREALEAGCDVLCEKPFVFDNSRSSEALLAEARELVDLAAARGRQLGLCTQYAMGARCFRALWDRRGGEAITHIHGHLEAPAKGRDPDPKRIWVDLSPHLISVPLELFSKARVDWESLETHFEGDEAIARFDIANGEQRVQCHLVTRNRREPPNNIRHFELNGYLFDVQGFNDDEGVFCARIVTPGGTEDQPDMMRLLIREFLAGRPSVQGNASVENLAIMLGILDRA